MPWLEAVGLAVAGLCLSALADEPEAVSPAVNGVPADGPVGERPYEMVWARRRERREPLVDFEDLSGWTLATYDGATGELRRSREQQMWGRHVAKLTYAGTAANSRLLLRPPNGITIPDRFDCVELWAYGNNWAWVPDPTTPQVELAVWLLDAKDAEHRVPLTNVRWKEWWLVHKRIPESALDQIAWPCRFAGLEVRRGANTEDRVLFLDSLSFHTEQLPALAFEARPARNLRLPPGQGQGLNGTGKGRLPFPTREETILPTNHERRFSTRARLTEGVATFTYAGRDCRVQYTLDPARGPLDGVTVAVDGETVSRPLTDGGLRFVDDRTTPDLLEAELAKGVLRATYRYGDVEARFSYRLWQKSLVIDAQCVGGEATELRCGRVTQVADPRLVLVPYLTLGGANPRVLLSGPPGRPRFTSVWVDWYRSNGSELYSSERAGADDAQINGGVRYHPKTDGRRNDLFERVFLTVSPVFEETLPTIANPRSPWGHVAGQRLWQESWGPGDFHKEHERSRTLRSYGIDMLTQCNHEIAWRDGGESFTLRTRAAPDKGGDEALQWYVAAQKSLGWRVGLYTNYTDFAPVNEHWDPDYVQRTPEGEWRPAWPRCYALKPSRAVELEARLAPIIKRKYAPNASYTDVHTAVAPWHYCDYDARVPGAGTFAATFYAYGELLLNERRIWQGPTWSEGTFQWLYAGLTDGNYGLAYTGVDLSEEPLNVAFDLLKIHPLECDIGMPWTGGFFKKPGWNAPERIDHSIDRFIATTIAYGHIGWLVEEAHGIERTCRSYYMLQQLQQRYAMQRPELIEYADEGGTFLTVSQALATDAIRLSRLHVRYENGLEAYVNGDREREWTVTTPGGAVTLPPAGWYAWQGKAKGRDRAALGFEEGSVLADGRRVDFVRSPAYDYLDARGQWTERAGIAAKGGVAVKKDGTQREMIDIHGNDEIGFAAAGPGTLEAFNEAGESLGEVPTRASRGFLFFQCVEGARRYGFSPRRGREQPRLSASLLLDRAQAVPGETVMGTLRLENRSRRPARIARAAIGVGERAPVPVESLGPLMIGAGESTQRSVPVRVPADVPTNVRTWLVARIAGSNGEEAEGWADLTAVPAADVRLETEPPPVGRAAAAAKLFIRSNLAATPGGAVALAATGGFSVEPERVELPATGEHVEVAITVTPPVEPGHRAVLRLEGSLGEHTIAREFQLRSEAVRPVIADLAAPTSRFSWGYAFRGQPERPGDQATGACFHHDALTCGGVEKRGLFSHPPYQGGVGYAFADFEPLTLSEEPSELHLFIGLRDGGDPSDGVAFSVVVTDEAGRRHDVHEGNWSQRAWKEVAVDLSAFAGQQVRIRLKADVGPEDNSTADWASWGEPVVRTKREIVRCVIEQ